MSIANQESHRIQKMEDEIFKRMMAKQKIKITGKLFTLGRELQKLKTMTNQELTDYINSLIKKYGVFETLNRLEK